MCTGLETELTALIRLVIALTVGGLSLAMVWCMGMMFVGNIGS